MTRSYVALDLETTGLDPYRDAIIEIGALRFEGEREVESFSTFVNPGRSVPLAITELTGITNADVSHAPPLRATLRRLSDFVGRSPVVGHNIAFDLAFLRQHNALVGNPAIDTFELAGILVPHASRYSLANLAEELDLHLPAQTHRALDDARMAHALYIALLERAAQLPPQILAELVRLGRRVNWGAVAFFRDAQWLRQRQGFRGGIGGQLAARRGGDAAGPLFVREMYVRPLKPREHARPIDEEALVALLDEDGPIAATFDAYEYRPQQIEMLRAVVRAFNAGHHLMVEAGTGTGKSLAYLLPAIEWAVLNRQHVVISTNTINLQEQLAHKDLPTLAEALYEFRYHVLKGRSHYLCRREFEALRRRGPRSEDEMRVLAKILLWLPNTLDGDGDALFLPTARERVVWHTLSAANEGCDPERCRFYRHEQCFFYQARAKAEGAHLLIVNHALLLSDIAAQNRILPDYELLIVDEAHHLENAATHALHNTMDWLTAQQMCDELDNPGDAFPGLLREITERVRKLPRRIRISLDDLVVHLQDAVPTVRHHLETLFETAETFLSEHTSGRNRYGARLRITSRVREQPAWEDLRRLWQQLRPHLERLAEELAKLTDALEALSDVDAPELDEVRGPLAGIQRRMQEMTASFDRFIAEPSEGEIYWLEMQGHHQTPSFNIVPLHVGDLLHRHFFGKKRSVILTSATLRIAGSFDYLRERLGASEIATLAVGSPFDYTSAALLYIVTDIPEPRRPGYQKAVEETLIELFKATRGRALCLFTAYSQLQATSQAIMGPLAREGITVYTQGTGSSRAQLLVNFRRAERAVLLGTRSFWEGVDIPGESLSCLVIVKLPFDVPDAPIVAARAEQYADPFNAYMVPEAVLRFTQGFGRLIRTASDQGIAVVLDRRLLTKPYGRQFLDSLPDPTVRLGTRAALPEVARRWLAGRPLPPAEADETVPWDVPPPEEPPWFWGA